VQHWIEFWQCRYCRKNFVVPRGLYQIIEPITNLPTSTDLVHLACEACHQISAYGKDNLALTRTLESLDSVKRPIVVGRLFSIYIECEDAICASPIRVYQPTGELSEPRDVWVFLEKNGATDSLVRCSQGHLAENPISVIVAAEV
jgi:hypothetical protein